MAMNERMEHGNTEISILGSLAQEARYYSQSAINNLLQLGRVLTEAKPLVKHGEWESWIAENSGMGVRSAQMIMQAYERFGNSEAVAQIGERSKVFKLLSLPAGTEDQFLADNDVSTMTSREVEEAVRKVREEMGLAISREKKARQAAEERTAELAKSVGSVPDYVAAELSEKQNTIDRQRQEIERVAEAGRMALKDAQDLRAKNADLQREINEQGALIEETQQEYDRMRSSLLAMQSAAAKGDAERTPADELTMDVFAGAVRQFVGTCARMPHMGHTFGTMTLHEKNGYDELLRTVEGWCKEARAAMNAIAYEEVEIRE